MTLLFGFESKDNDDDDSACAASVDRKIPSKADWKKRVLRSSETFCKNGTGSFFFISVSWI